MKKVIIQSNSFFYRGTATTQEDNHHGVLNRFELFLSDENGKPRKEVAGKLVEHTNKQYAVFHGSIRYNLPSTDITFEPNESNY